MRLSPRNQRVTVNVIGTPALQKKILALPRALKARAADVYLDWGKRTVQLARQLAPKDSTKLAKSIDFKFYSRTMDAVVFATAKYAPSVEFGSKPHPSAKRRGKRAMPPKGVMLAWMKRHGIPKEAEFVLRRYVKQHGTPAMPFMTPAWESSRPVLLVHLQLALKNELGKMQVNSKLKSSKKGGK